MTRYEYIQETTESIADDKWKILLDKHNCQGWELSSINHQDVYERILDHKATVKLQETKSHKQALYLIIFKRAY